MCILCYLRQYKECENMKKEEYDKLNNNEKIDILNKYIGKTKEFQSENDFSWSYATDHCEWAKIDGKYVAYNPNGIKPNLTDIQKKAIALLEMKKFDTKRITVDIPEKYLQQINKEVETTGLKKTDIIKYIFYKYFEE